MFSAEYAPSCRVVQKYIHLVQLHMCKQRESCYIMCRKNTLVFVLCAV